MKSVDLSRVRSVPLVTNVQIRQVIRHLEDAQAVVETRGGAQFLLIGPRRYLAEHVAFVLAHRGFDLLDGTEADGAKPFEARDLIRLLDLGLTLLGDLASEINDVQRLRDGALRLRALLCIQEKELDLASHSLDQHSSGAPDAYALLRTHLLFNCNQPAEAQAYALEWIRANASMAPSVATTAVDLLVRPQA